MKMLGDVVPDGIRLAVLCILIWDLVPRWMHKASTWYGGLLRPHPPRPQAIDLLTRMLGEEQQESFDISGYQNSSALQRWGRTSYDMSWKISIHVFAWRREKSLRRLCESLLRASYAGQEIPLYIHVDGEPLDLVVQYANALNWPHGPKIVNVRERRLGMPDAILSGWTPKEDEEYAILLEDDVEVSVGFFEFALYCLSMSTYKRMTEGEEHGMMGCSLYTPRVDEIGPAPNAWSPPTWNPPYAIGPRHRLFYFQLPCSWGAIYHAKYWRDFLRYYSIRRQLGDAFPETPHSRSNEWFQSWKRILIELMLFRGWYLLYPSFHSQASFSTNYFEKGIHSVAEGKPAPVPNEIRKFGDRRFTVPLIQDFGFRASLPIPSVGVIKRIPYVNLYHRRVLSRRELVLDVKPFLEKVHSPELHHFFNQPIKLPVEDSSLLQDRFDEAEEP